MQGWYNTRKFINVIYYIDKKKKVYEISMDTEIFAFGNIWHHFVVKTVITLELMGKFLNR